MLKAYHTLTDKLAVWITSKVATMECAFVFSALAIYGGTGVKWSDPFQVVQWISQTFLQLVLLSVIMLGQRLQGSSTEDQAKEMHDTIMQEFALAQEQREITAKQLQELVELHAELKDFIAQKVV